MDAPRIALCTPTYDGRVHASFTRGIDHIRAVFDKEGIGNCWIDAGRCANLPRLRNMLAGEALSWGADAILWVDSDIRGNGHDALKLWKSGKDIIGAAPEKRILSRNTPPSVAFKRLPGNQVAIEDGLILVGGVATAFCLVRRAVYEALKDNGVARRMYYPEMPQSMKNPWFRNYYWYELVKAEGQSEDGEDWFVDEGEDLYFCNKAREAGFKCYIEPNVRPVHHEGGMQLDKNFWDIHGKELETAMKREAAE